MVTNYLKKLWRTEKKTYNNSIVHNTEVKKDFIETINEFIDFKHYYIIVGHKFLDLTLSSADNLKKGQKVVAEEITNYFLGIPILTDLKINGKSATVYEETSTSGTKLYSYPALNLDASKMFF